MWWAVCTCTVDIVYSRRLEQRGNVQSQSSHSIIQKINQPISILLYYVSFHQGRVLRLNISHPCPYRMLWTWSVKQVCIIIVLIKLKYFSYFLIKWTNSSVGSITSKALDTTTFKVNFVINLKVYNVNVVQQTFIFRLHYFAYLVSVFSLLFKDKTLFASHCKIHLSLYFIA